MKAIIDRFESGYAVCKLEDGSMLDIKRFRIPNGAAEGTVLNIIDEEITIDLETTNENSQAIKEQAEKLWEE